MIVKGEQQQEKKGKKRQDPNIQSPVYDRDAVPVATLFSNI